MANSSIDFATSSMEKLTVAVAAWKQALAGLDGPTRLASGVARPSGQPEMLELDCPTDLTELLLSQASRHEVPLSALFHAVWGILLHRLTGQSNPVFGVMPMGGAGIGEPSDFLPLRVKISPAEPLLDLVTRLRDEYSRLSQHHLPIAGIEYLAGVREIFDTRIVLDCGPAAQAPGGGGIALRLVISSAPQLRLSFHYSSGLFDRGKVESLAARLVTLLDAAAKNPLLQVWQMDGLTAQERKQLLEGWNNRQHAIPEATVTALLESQVARSPDAVALIDQQHELTYTELNRRANQLAHALISMGAGPETLVGIALQRTSELVVALLAVLKAGAGYVPFDAKYPEARLRHMFANSSPIMVLTSEAVLPTLPPDWDTKILVLDGADARALVGRQAAHNPTDAERTLPLMPQHCAYIIYTSGSTGKPKGVQIEHRNVAVLAAWGGNVFTNEEWSGVLASTSITFDLSVFELFVTLIHGGTVILAASALDLPTLPKKEKVRLINTVPSAGRALLEIDGIPASVITVNLAGEALKNSLVQELYSTGHIRHVYNLYGPSEDTTYSTFSLCARGDDEQVTIGTGIWNTRTYVLDPALEPVPAGVAGELYLAGGGLARGYLGQPGLTAERFLADPHCMAGSRMYRTGDRVRWREDGTLEFLGRSDDQVKIRGFRIELGEIESVLSSHSAVAQAVVIAREERPGQKYLAAYVVAAYGAALVPADLQRYLCEYLPDYMVPAAIMALPALPLTANGKLNKAALPAPEFAIHSGAAPRTPQEEILANLFAEVLGLGQVGIDDNFFYLGGHSLLVTRLISRVRSSLGVELTIPTVFAAPTVAKLAKCLDQADKARPLLRPMPRPDKMPLSYAQRRLWFLHHLESAGSTYNIALALHLEGPIDAAALESALHDVVARHESLRTIFPEGSGFPQQTILNTDTVCPSLEISDVSAAELQTKVQEATAYEFDLLTEIPLHAVLFRVDDQWHVFLLLIHHIAADGWSLAPLASDLAAAYAARLENKSPGWRALSVQYADYTLWQRELMGEEGDAGSAIMRQLEYWQKALAVLPEEMDLPRDRQRPPVNSYRGEVLTFLIDAALHRELIGLAREAQASLFMVLHAALSALLMRLGAGADIVMGSPIAGRTDRELDELVGFFVNTLVLRTDVSGDPTFHELLRRVRENDLAAYTHQDLPFETLVEALNPPRSLSRHPLFQVMLALQNNLDANFELSGVKVTSEPVDTRTAKLDLTFSFDEQRGRNRTPEGMKLSLEYASDLFDRSTAESIGRRTVSLLVQIAANPSQPVSHIEMLSPAERQRILVEWNETKQALPEVSLPEMFEKQVERTPHASAVVCGRQEITYSELNERANRLAHWLVMEGVGPETIVGAAMPRSVELVLALLGILKAGGVYLPLDPEYPRERVRTMIEHAAPVCVLTNEEVAACLPQNLHLLLLDDPGMICSLAAKPGSNLTDAHRIRRLRPENPVYIIYTSGSTGVPKGIVMPASSMVNLLSWHTALISQRSDSRVVQFTAISFDVSIQEILSTLISGKTLFIVDADTRRDPIAFLSWLEQHAINELFAPNLVVEALADAAKQSRREAPSLTEISQAGEALVLSEHIRQFCRAPGRQLRNHYGPAETHVCTAFDLRVPIDEWGRTAPIGRPVWNTQVYVLDANLEPVPAGVRGELYIAGAGLSRGYLGRPDLTGDRFLPNPLGPPGSRMYRSGDLARWNADGMLEFLGRADDQVKIRGFRIEPAEIESALASHPGVAQAAVVAHELPSGVKQLAAYVVCSAEASPDGPELKSFLRGRLPDYMVPAAIMPMSHLPLTPNGKLDKRALPRTDVTVQNSRPPRTAEEEIVAELFAEILGVEELGIDDDFFDLGGHSLLAMQLVSRVRHVLMVEVPVREVFQNPTVAEFSTVMINYDPIPGHTANIARIYQQLGSMTVR